ncbi:NAD-dependent succinate-semialdehyde dehydrogenase [Sporolactobacillus shoreicorticis]|uniref:NAD-dependent succinate-semialdehyde dehydrogenase n=1 Tax=Sporolactobacillus shoreicorticis TaxID=1923877 RepID=A0ABW5S3T0_9BACL|nr:NAD-dependent succinate-semialdehyde dehydrogenase [Sporolactobacillus shoreicorticis]MCO7127546.1 NAD-dependent succinate-semialdehyde dehydrogenase [Sporolactobacillus shoreicorticis]
MALENSYVKQAPKQLFIGGEWIDAESMEVDDVVNPATGEVIAKVARGGAVDTEKAIEAAQAAFPVWSSMPVDERAKILRKVADLITEKADELAEIMTIEQGKPLAQAKGEVLGGAESVRWHAEEMRRIYGETIPGPGGHLFLVKKEPLGVVGAITPWNFPSSMITRKISPALAGGNTIVLKPSPETPLSATSLMEIFQEAGIPDGTVNLVIGDAPAIGKTLTSSNAVRKITFTGSTGVGKMLFEQSAHTLKKVSLELGGHAPFIVFDDAPVDQVVTDLVSSKFRNNGQVCTSPNRIFVHESIFAEFTDKLVAAVKKVKVGNGLEEGVDAGPLIREDAIEKIQRQVNDAVEKGAMLATGGKRLIDGDYAMGNFYAPTVLLNVTNQMDIFYQETFGPVLPVIKFTDTDEVIGMANDTNYGLASYFYTLDLKRIAKVSQGLQYGMVGVNSNTVAFTQTPFGGVKHSGFGRENGHQGIDDYVNVKFINLNYGI